MKPVAILGSGPAGLLAAHAVGLCGHPIAIISKPVKSRIGGAQFLHEPIPELTSPEPDAVITYRVRGDAETYERKVYGQARPDFVSFSNVQDGMTKPAWNLVGIYDRLWDSLGGSLTEMDITEEWLQQCAGDFSMIISTIPLPVLCRSEAGVIQERHFFHEVTEQIVDRCVEPVPDGVVLYDGTASRSWHRSSNLFGQEGTEWGQSVPMDRLPFPDVQVVRKPLKTTCNCHPDVVRVGRYGSWTKGKLVSDAFKDTVLALNARGMLPPR